MIPIFKILKNILEKIRKNPYSKSVSEKRKRSNLSIYIKNTNYKMESYFNVLKNSIKQALKKFDKVVGLCTSYSQVDYIKRNFPEALTNKDENLFTVV